MSNLLVLLDHWIKTHPRFFAAFECEDLNASELGWPVFNMDPLLLGAMYRKSNSIPILLIQESEVITCDGGIIPYRHIKASDPQFLPELEKYLEERLNS